MQKLGLKERDWVERTPSTGRTNFAFHYNGISIILTKNGWPPKLLAKHKSRPGLVSLSWLSVQGFAVQSPKWSSWVLPCGRQGGKGILLGDEVTADRIVMWHSSTKHVLQCIFLYINLDGFQSKERVQPCKCRVRNGRCWSWKQQCQEEEVAISSSASLTGPFQWLGWYVDLCSKYISCTWIYLDIYKNLQPRPISGTLQDYVDVAGKKIDQAEDLKASWGEIKYVLSQLCRIPIS